MPSLLEVYDKDRWVTVGCMLPGERPGSVSDNQPRGRDVYIFECALDDSRSMLYRSRFGIDMDDSSTRRIDAAGREVVKELVKGESYETTIKTDKSPEPRRIRFRHV